MPLKYHKPKTPGQRSRLSLDFSHLREPKDLPLWRGIKKSLHRGKKEKAGRNHKGRLTIWHRGGGHKRSYRKVLFKQSLLQPYLADSKSREILLHVKALLYDPNRSADLALIHLEVPQDSPKPARRTPRPLMGSAIITRDNSPWFYMLAPRGIRVGDRIPYRGEYAAMDLLQPGETLPVQDIPLGTLIHNIELQKGKGGQAARAAGTFGQIMEKVPAQRKVRIRMPSKEERWLYYNSFATVGSVGNEDRRHLVLAKAGRSRWLSRRPKVRGVAMNPVDHPHGGGEGRTSGGRPSVTPWGRPARKVPTRRKGPHPFRI